MLLENNGVRIEIDDPLQLQHMLSLGWKKVGGGKTAAPAPESKQETKQETKQEPEKAPAEQQAPDAPAPKVLNVAQIYEKCQEAGVQPGELEMAEPLTEEVVDAAIQAVLAARIEAAKGKRGKKP